MCAFLSAALLSECFFNSFMSVIRHLMCGSSARRLVGVCDSIEVRIHEKSRAKFILALSTEALGGTKASRFFISSEERSAAQRDECRWREWDASRDNTDFRVAHLVFHGSLIRRTHSGSQMSATTFPITLLIAFRHERASRRSAGSARERQCSRLGCRSHV